MLQLQVNDVYTQKFCFVQVRPNYFNDLAQT